MRKLSFGCIFLFVLLVFFNAVPLFPEEPVTETSQSPYDIEKALAAISKVVSGEGILKICGETTANLKTYDEYEKFTAGLKDMISAKQNSPAVDFLCYAAAETRLRQLEFLANQNNIESGRIYMSVNDLYYNESLEYLDRSLAVTREKKLIIDIYFLKFLIYREKFQAQKTEETFERLAGAISTYGESGEERKKELAGIIEKFNGKGLADDALKLKLAYAQKADVGGAQEVMEDILASADRAFDQGNTRAAGVMYDRYVKEGQAYFTKEAMAPKLMEIAEKYFTASKHREARTYYEFYKETFPDSNFKDYCDYRIGLCLYQEKDIVKAIAQLDGFLGGYKTSVWFDKAFDTLSGIYYTNYPDEKAIEGLNGVIDKYYRKNAGGYARILIALIYYGEKKYDKSLAELKKIEPSSVYSYSASMIADDIAEIKKGQTPTFTFASRDSYRVWEVHTATMFDVVPSENGNKIEAVLEDNGAFRLNVKPGAAVKFDISTAQDLDRFNEYLLDGEDISRLPKKIQEATEKDILSVEWTADGGLFADEKQSRSKVWQAPAEPGTYKVSLRVDDFGLVRPPDKGLRKDSTGETSFIIVVTE